MLEIIILWALTRRIGAIVEQKGRRSGGYKALTVLLWIGGELLGAFIGAAEAAPGSQGGIYVLALMGAGLGALAAFAIANHAAPLNRPVVFAAVEPVNGGSTSAAE